LNSEEVGPHGAQLPLQSRFVQEERRNKAASEPHKASFLAGVEPQPMVAGNAIKAPTPSTQLSNE
jgi:hypothetical protein